mmetsp:Transcript_14274/g.35823  ORF Transcript_14274/g.35823 Transcript_14274/m.35823 type:complete len:244 (-) Transcript_14274:195-926(-)
MGGRTQLFQQDTKMGIIGTTQDGSRCRGLDPITFFCFGVFGFHQLALELGNCLLLVLGQLLGKDSGKFLDQNSIVQALATDAASGATNKIPAKDTNDGSAGGAGPFGFRGIKGIRIDDVSVVVLVLIVVFPIGNLLESHVSNEVVDNQILAQGKQPGLNGGEIAVLWILGKEFRKVARVDAWFIVVIVECFVSPDKVLKIRCPFLGFQIRSMTTSICLRDKRNQCIAIRIEQQKKERRRNSCR